MFRLHAFLAISATDWTLQHTALLVPWAMRHGSVRQNVVVHALCIIIVLLVPYLRSFAQMALMAPSLTLPAWQIAQAAQKATGVIQAKLLHARKEPLPVAHNVCHSMHANRAHSTQPRMALATTPQHPVCASQASLMTLGAMQKTPLIIAPAHGPACHVLLASTAALPSVRPSHPTSHPSSGGLIPGPCNQSGALMLRLA
mmetsp:Transcript_76621/g.151868  ORF Transcript_76621/g.151868 Transcript_76621/m.151868 type:complete len:200 (-) Transcript_76621:2521-3120(-)